MVRSGSLWSDAHGNEFGSASSSPGGVFRDYSLAGTWTVHSWEVLSQSHGTQPSELPDFKKLCDTVNDCGLS